MHQLELALAEKLVPSLIWANAQSYKRDSGWGGASGGVLVVDTATIIDDPFASVGVE